MPGLKKLAFAYLVSASAFGLAAVAAAHPGLRGAGGELARRLAHNVWQPAMDYAWRADALLLDAPDTSSNARVMLALEPPVPGADRTSAHLDLPEIIRTPVIDRPHAAPQVAMAAPELIAPDLPPLLPENAGRDKPAGAASRVSHDAPILPPLAAASLTPEQTRAQMHLAARLTPQMRAHFDLFLFVSKAASGPLAQRMYVFRQEDGGLRLIYDWAASTGRERPERNARGERDVTTTPGGFYQFDPTRMYPQYRSVAWNQEMPYSMFFNWQHDGLEFGLAIHGATGADIARLGTRASAGCVHLAPDHARTLFNLVRDAYRGAVPRFASDANETMRRDGSFARDAGGNLRMTAGYKVLIDIEDYGGDKDDAVAALF